ncbi:MAG: hypothetical protein AAGA27_07985 [Pseudomonadota bacterium]
MFTKRLSIPLSEEQHKLIKLSAIASGLSIKEYVLSKLIKKSKNSSIKTPNKATLKAIRDVEEGRNLISYKNVDEMLKDLGLK